MPHPPGAAAVAAAEKARPLRTRGPVAAVTLVLW
jgi:hypothetical protein